MPQTRLQQQLERSQRPKLIGEVTGRFLVALAVVTLGLGLGVLALSMQLDVNKVETTPPQLALQQDPDAAELQVLRVEPGLDWSDLVLDGDCQPLLNGQPLANTPTQDVQPGDVLSCASGKTLQISSTPQRGDAVLYATELG